MKHYRPTRQPSAIDSPLNDTLALIRENQGEEAVQAHQDALARLAGPGVREVVELTPFDSQEKIG